MSSGESERSSAGLTALPSVDQLQRAGDGYEEQSVREAFDAFRRHTAQLQAQLRVLQAARKTVDVGATGTVVVTGGTAVVLMELRSSGGG